ncbi:MAG: UpxY family transcription antiterminator [Cyclobacteriaceae bacterium]|nr:UpxY family transcription antiterminator [Cyclobacteriaceae bacterium]UYN85608.1 MAG: UpxY family transcription antiterminator [Cyclobacteriaceae bacterium]
MNEEKKWFVFYTKSRQEKKVTEILARRGFDVFLPLVKVLRQWSDRKKKVEVPLFNSYLFVNTVEHRLQEVLSVPGIAWTIRHNGKPAILREKEYQLIKRLLDTGLTIDVVPLADVAPGDWVEVMDGPLKRAVGQVLAKNPGRFMVLLEAIGQVMRVEIDPGLLKKI